MQMQWFDNIVMNILYNSINFHHDWWQNHSCPTSVVIFHWNLDVGRDQVLVGYVTWSRGMSLIGKKRFLESSNYCMQNLLHTILSYVTMYHKPLVKSAKMILRYMYTQNVIRSFFVSDPAPTPYFRTNFTWKKGGAIFALVR